MVKRDRAALDHLVHDSVTYMHSNGRIETKKQFMDMVLNERVYKSVDTTEILSKQLPGVGVLTCKITLSAEGREPNNIPIQTQVWSEFPDGWRLVLRQSTKP
jgi:hypothetical protein